MEVTGLHPPFVDFSLGWGERGVREFDRKRMPQIVFRRGDTVTKMQYDLFRENYPNPQEIRVHDPSLDEEFYWTQNDAKDSIKNLISVMQKDKNRSKSKEELRKIVENYLNSTITRGECQELLKHIYGANDFEYVKNDLDMFCAKDNLS